MAGNRWTYILPPWAAWWSTPLPARSSACKSAPCSSRQCSTMTLARLQAKCSGDSLKSLTAFTSAPYFSSRRTMTTSPRRHARCRASWPLNPDKHVSLHSRFLVGYVQNKFITASTHYCCQRNRTAAEFAWFIWWMQAETRGCWPSDQADQLGPRVHQSGAGIHIHHNGII